LGLLRRKFATMVKPHQVRGQTYEASA
jgi:hypothetical protein